MNDKKIAIITGSAQGIGSAIAKAFSHEGYKVVAVDKKEQPYSGLHFYPQNVDLRNKEEIKELFSWIKQEFGTAHVLINNAAVSRFHQPILEMDPEKFDEVMAVNLRASFLCCKEFVALNQGESYGRIINIASTRWAQNEPDWDVYGASKGGLISLTESLCISLQDTPITVNAISPGWIETENEEMLTKEDHDQHPSGRVGRPRDIARACLFLADTESDFINGANLVIDGGMSKKMIYV